MTEPDEDTRWREIVENYGERPRLADDEPPDDPRPAPAPDPASYDVDEEIDRYVPPAPPPLPRPEPPRLIAWAGVLGAPLVLLAVTILGLSVPPLVTYAAITWFVGAFVFLVVSMPRGPRDPGDDGARL